MMSLNSKAEAPSGLLVDIPIFLASPSFLSQLKSLLRLNYL